MPGLQETWKAHLCLADLCRQSLLATTKFDGASTLTNRPTK
jgi:hypothetical protein